MKSIEELKAIRDRMQSTLNLRDDNKRIRIVVGMATCGIAAGARPVLNAITEEVATRALKDVMVTQTGCIGICKLEPVVEVYQGGDKTTYVKMTPERAKRVIAEHIVNGNVVTEFTIGAYQ
jgi:NADP-reducing hydrogenase subunit HndB